VLQEWVAGLPATDWPNLVAAPAAWFRLLSQAALGLHTAHQAGLVHGRLGSSSLVLTKGGVLKVVGLGEPSWLTGGESAEPSADLRALGRLAADWLAQAPKRKGAKTKPLPDGLQAVLNKLWAGDGEERPPAELYASASALLEDLDRAGAELPAGGDAWEKLVQHVGENATAEPEPRRRSA
jgi:hypothetical protein